ncbi:hypothetical protein [Bacillus sp. 3103sda1]|uniref:hypothetical protein n=1 Tax=Bacillus sp. 3103sda1 TaxID=2953808 RepID=UPI0026469FA2
MKVYKFSDCDWVCAETDDQAKTFYKEETGFDDDDINECFEGEVSLQETMYVDIDELPESEKNNFQFGKPYGDKIFVHKTFEWVIKHENITEPCIIASTEH